MNAPEKIQIHFIKNDYDDWSVRGYSFLENKQMGMTEYTRTDAFIEKAANYIANNMRCDGYTLQTKAKFIKGFKNYMKGK